MSRIVVIVQRVDEHDDHRAFLIGWLKEFAKIFDEVSVITVAEGAHALPSNVRVYSLGKERGISKFGQGLRLYQYLIRLLPGARGVFAHASPIFVLAAWPLAFLYRKKLVLWYLHRAAPLKLRLAIRLSTWVVTADAASLTVESPKIISVGHGIDTVHWAVVRDWSVLQRRPLHVASIGRLSPIKGYETLIRSAAILREAEFPVQVRIVGQAVMPGDRRYAASLHELASRLGMADCVSFVGSVPYRDIIHQYAWADIIVGCTPPGGIDKALLEGMAAGCPVLTSNTAMRRSLEPYADRLVFRHGDAHQLADMILALGDWQAISEAMVRNVREYHDVRRTIASIAALL
jgi:glycosyltransferase involved in cell wall biosynthesis